MTYFEQMAVTTLLSNPEVARRIRSCYLASDAPAARRKKVREIFANFLIEDDGKFGRVPEGDQYVVQRGVTTDILKFAGSTPDGELSSRDAFSVTAQLGIVATEVNGVVDWYDASKNFGFVAIEKLGESAFLHASLLEKYGVESVHDGDILIVDVSRSSKGLSISRICEQVVNRPVGDGLREVVIVKTFLDRGYGFVYVPSLNQDAFFHMSALPTSQHELFSAGARLRAEVINDVKGRGLQVRRFELA